MAVVQWINEKSIEQEGNQGGFNPEVVCMPGLSPDISKEGQKQGKA